MKTFENPQQTSNQTGKTSKLMQTCGSPLQWPSD